MTVSQTPQIDCLLIDLDDTLYEIPEISNMVADKIRTYMVTRLGVEQDQVEENCRELYLNYGTTLAGLVATGYTVDFDDWHAHVHGTLPYEDFFRPDPNLKALLNAIPLKKFIFTNADHRHAQRCLRLLDLNDCFQGIICFENVMEEAERRGMVHHGRPIVCKPQRQAFELALTLASASEGQQQRPFKACSTAFFDDSTRNITSAHRMGMYAVLVGRRGVACDSSLQVESMHEVIKTMPFLIPSSATSATVASEEEEVGVEVENEEEEEENGVVGEEETARAVCVQAV